MNLKAYPVDKQLCYLKIVTCKSSLPCIPHAHARAFLDGSTRDMVNVTWADESPIDVSTDITEADLKLVEKEAVECNGTYFNSMSHGKGAGLPSIKLRLLLLVEFSCLLARFYLERNVGYSLLQTYIPTSFIVMISWYDPSKSPVASYTTSDTFQDLLLDRSHFSARPRRSLGDHPTDSVDPSHRPPLSTPTRQLCQGAGRLVRRLLAISVRLPG